MKDMKMSFCVKGKTTRQLHSQNCGETSHLFRPNLVGSLKVMIIAQEGGCGSMLGKTLQKDENLQVESYK